MSCEHGNHIDGCEICETIDAAYRSGYIAGGIAARPAMTPNAAAAQYAERDPMELDRDGNYYCRHVRAMTAEGLHEKSAIAAELAWRDREIDRLRSLAQPQGEGVVGYMDPDAAFLLPKADGCVISAHVVMVREPHGKYTMPLFTHPAAVDEARVQAAFYEGALCGNTSGSPDEEWLNSQSRAALTAALQPATSKGEKA